VRHLAVLFLHLLATVARLVGPGGARSVVAESVLVKQQLLILNVPENGPRCRSPEPRDIRFARPSSAIRAQNDVLFDRWRNG
jgi:hypothetical protein